MQDTLEHESGLIFSIKTFRPLWIFPWLSSVWRQFPFATCIATVSYNNERAAEEGHQELIALLRRTTISSDMSEAFKVNRRVLQEESRVWSEVLPRLSGARRRRK